MDKIRALRGALSALPLLTCATFADAAPAGPTPDRELAGPTVSKAGVTIGRHRALPKKKRIHHERKT
ncbi:hypothetical protein [Methylobacterium sp. NEAU K]|uniref:hypothetical protein n=1 Tax=Methylobacterium sp. NEAU K TaxID=3064946 RepID=UPI0027330E9A|nr:hypothetical protein [Methylobacterium sp. NEAU K]MDP4003258.1 hypothetical protein [Methylobacterium sp. NEAU K]